MFDATTTYADLDEANKQDGHYHRFDGMKPPCLKLAETAYEREFKNLGELDVLNDKGLVDKHMMHIAGLALFAAESVKRVFTDAWWCEVNRLSERYEMDAEAWQYHRLSRSAIETRV